jgi:hypothetical protein
MRYLEKKQENLENEGFRGEAVETPAAGRFVAMKRRRKATRPPQMQSSYNDFQQPKDWKMKPFARTMATR